MYKWTVIARPTINMAATATVVYVVEPIDSIPWMQLFAPGVANNASDKSVAHSSDFDSCRNPSFTAEDGGGKDIDTAESSCLQSCCCGII